MKKNKKLSDEEFLNLLEQSKEDVEIPQTFENKINTHIDYLVNKDKLQVFSLKKAAIWAGSIAASIVIIFSIGFYFKNNYRKEQLSDNQQISIENLTVGDREKILAAHRALVLVSNNYNKSLNSMQKAENQIQQIQNIVNKSFNKK
ncbi:MAG: hypothetical protein FWD66_09115 [Paludibacter sp.]|nr:hypothetical protein [Paludibacter sp.]